MNKGVLAIACAITVAAGACTSESKPGGEHQIATISPAERELATLGSTAEPVAKALNAIPVDPITALAAADQALDFAVKLKSLFGGKEKDETAKRLADIQRQNAQIISMMKRALAVLENLGVTINRALLERSSAELNTNLRAHLQLVYENWQTELQDRSAARASVVAYKGLIEDIRSITRNFVDDQTYGFAYFQNVGEGMLAEIWLSNRLGEKPARRAELAVPYMAYFERVNDAEVPGSISAQLRRASALQKRTSTILDQADSTIASGYSTKTTSNKQQGICYYEYTTTHRVVGNRAKGYSVDSNTRETKRECEGGPQHLPKSAPAAQEPSDRGDMSAKGRASYWNDVRIANAKAREEMEVLQKYGQAATTYLEAARELL